MKVFVRILLIMLLLSCEEKEGSVNDLVFNCKKIIVDKSASNNVFYFLIEVNNKSKRDVYFKKGYENNKNFPGVYDSFFYLEYQQKQIPLYTSIESEVLIKKGTSPIFVFFTKENSLELDVEKVKLSNIKYNNGIEEYEGQIGFSKVEVLFQNRPLDLDDFINILSGKKPRLDGLNLD